MENNDKYIKLESNLIKLSNVCKAIVELEKMPMQYGSDYATRKASRHTRKSLNRAKKHYKRLIEVIDKQSKS